MEDLSINAATNSAAFFRFINHPVKVRLFLLKNLPAAYFSGLQIIKINEKECIVSVPFKWFTRNPFRSTYFACLSMAAELSTGALGMANTYKRKPAVSMLIVSNEGKFFKKATGITVFTCSDGEAISNLIDEAIRTGAPQTIITKSAGYNEQKELVAEFTFTWSFKSKK